MWIRNITTGEIKQHREMFPNTSFAEGDVDCTPEWLASVGCEEYTLPTYVYVPTTDDIIKNLTAGLEGYYDRVAQVKRYDNRLTCALRAGYVGPFQQEGIDFAVWMDNCNAYGYLVMQDCLNAIRTIPTIPELIAELPAPPWEVPAVAPLY